MDAALHKEMLELAKRLAEEAGGIAWARFGPTRRRRVQRKADNSVVTDADHATQAHILQAIAEAYPEHAVCAEETVVQPNAHADMAKARYCWVIDPLDGTRNYASGFPCFATSIAVLDRGQPVVGVVREHNLKSVYAAVGGCGATLNGQTVHVAESAADADLLVGFPSTKESLTVRVVRSWVATRGLILRNLGSTALHLGMVASGALGAAFCKQCKIWDVAAGALIVTEAGGRITDLAGDDLAPFDLNADPNEDIPFLSAASNTHQRLLESIRSIVPGP